MNKRDITIGLLSGFLIISLLTPVTSSAFWPFDQIFQKGEVKGETTDTSVKKQNVLQKIFNTDNTQNSQTNIQITEDELLDRETTLNDTRLKEGLKGRKISAAQLKLIQQKLALIRAKKAELKKLQQEFQTWLKLNKIDPKDYMEENMATPPATTKKEVIKITPEAVTTRPSVKSNIK